MLEELPANSNATGWFPAWVTISDPESPPPLSALVMTCFTNRVTPLSYRTKTVAFTPVTVPLVNPVVRPYFCTARLSTAGAGVELGVP